MEKENIQKAIYAAIRTFNAQLPDSRKLSPTLECQLVGSTELDSVELVQLLVLIEQQLEQDLNMSVSLFDSEGSEQGIERFVSVKALVEVLAEKLALGAAE